jgi:hypothetical protein
VLHVSLPLDSPTVRNCKLPPRVRKITKSPVKPRLETLEERELLSADPLSQIVAAPPIAHAGSTTAGANNEVSSLTSGQVLNLAHTIESEIETAWQGYVSRAVSMAKILWADLHGQNQGTIATGQSQVGSGSGGGSGGNGVASRPLTATTKAKDSGSGHGFSALVSGSGSGLVSGEVWQDSNGNGILDTGETGMSGITVNLDDPTGTVLMTTTTDSNGNYLLGVNPGLGTQFEIQVVIPSGDSATLENAGSPPQIYSSIDASGYSAVFAFVPGGEEERDAGLVPGAPPPNTDSLIWNPQGGSTLASQASNWYDVKQKKNDVVAPSATNPVIFNNLPSFDPVVSNSPIVWDQNISVASIQLASYTGLMTIKDGLKVEDTGNFWDTKDSKLNVFFGRNAEFQLDAGGGITSMTLAGDPSGSLKIAGGTTDFADASGEFPPYQYNIGANIYVAGGATLEDKSYVPNAIRLSRNFLWRSGVMKQQLP